MLLFRSEDKLVNYVYRKEINGGITKQNLSLTKSALEVEAHHNRPGIFYIQDCLLQYKSVLKDKTNIVNYVSIILFVQ